ncbi:hypothetical protein [Glutamicibacter sp.]|jgi:hypothetical protein
MGKHSETADELMLNVVQGVTGSELNVDSSDQSIVNEGEAGGEYEG